ncbi:hypothetical protein SteCoe_2703 [Stentor coeruleus]|uniref:Cyclin-like domain-containing protein n=1 Tax=Stentor coeruleus TaxID=5963 RepID=A0A1R2CYZ9_9CILI|nr:hypothetical protein SteCoe_2703 [Stentor coeruleus]
MSDMIESILQSRKREPFAELPSESLEQNEIILQHLIDKKQEYLENPLENHAIHPSLRARMAEWMIEIITSFGLKHRTYFLAVNIMDIFLKITQKEFTSKSMHLIGVCCMMIASKFNDSRHITIDSAHRYISCRALREEELVSMENDIIKTVTDQLGMVTCYDVTISLCEKYKVGAKVRRTATTILYLIQMYYDSLRFSVNAQAYGAFLISLYTLDQSNIIEEVRRERDCSVEIRVIETMHSGILKFMNSFPCFSNPMRFLEFEFNRDRSGELFVFRHASRFD